MRKLGYVLSSIFLFKHQHYYIFFIYELYKVYCSLFIYKPSESMFYIILTNMTKLKVYIIHYITIPIYSSSMIIRLYSPLTD